ncbi:hypothetical protein [Kibdelosporangium philippinense]|uniref:hypothetical protein n=1 Tax=Kibdelosporangium philippinense TaxID=211113 RepID=UPI003618A546
MQVVRGGPDPRIQRFVPGCGRSGLAAGPALRTLIDERDQSRGGAVRPVDARAARHYRLTGAMPPARLAHRHERVNVTPGV